MNKSASYHHGDLRRALLEAADIVLKEQGLQGFTLRACARAAGVSHAAPKHHFGDARGLLTAVAERGFARLVDALVTEIEPVRGDLDAEMIATSSAYIRFAETNPEHFRIMFRTDLTNANPEQPAEPILRTFTELTNIILRQRNEPELGPDEMVLDKSDALINDIVLGWSYIHGYAHLRLEGGLDMVSEEMHRQQMRVASLRLGHLIRSYSFEDALDAMQD